MFCNLIIADIDSLKRIDIENFLREYQTKYANLMKYTLLVFDEKALLNDPQDFSQNRIWQEYQGIRLKKGISCEPDLIEEMVQELDEKFYIYNCYIIGTSAG